MAEVARPDSFYVEELDSVFGPFQILKYRDAIKEATPLPKLLICESNIPDSTIKTIWNPLLDKWTNHGDIALLNGRGQVRVVLCKSANANTLLVTERCDNLCLFCSQPPRDVDDTVLFAYAAQSIVSFRSSDVIGISGGEPLFDKKAILNFFKILNEFNDKTPLHILSNGRAFKDINFTENFKEAALKRKIEIGIPLYSTSSRTHDYLVNSKGAWNDTIKGLINAGNRGIPIELRVIPTQANFSELSSIVEMALTCFNSITRVSIMNLEQTGWAKKNWKNLYLKPELYCDELQEACLLGDRFGVDISLFNYPLCHISEELYKFAKKSISDWKNSFPADCEYCTIKSDCGGFFSSIRNMEVMPKGRIM